VGRLARAGRSGQNPAQTAGPMSIWASQSKDLVAKHPAERECWFVFKDRRIHERIVDWLESEDIELITAHIECGPAGSCRRDRRADLTVTKQEAVIRRQCQRWAATDRFLADAARPGLLYDDLRLQGAGAGDGAISIGSPCSSTYRVILPVESLSPR
jgi:hypothetical protein